MFVLNSFYLNVCSTCFNLIFLMFRSLSQCYCRSIPPPLSSTDLAKIKESSISNSSPPSSAPPILNNKLNHSFIQNGNLKFNSTNDKNIAVPRMGISAGAGAVN